MDQPTQRRFPWHTWIGLGVLITAEALLLSGNRLVSNWFTPIQWTGYILLADGIVFRLRGSSWLTARLREVPLLALSSVAIWVVFEAYNLHLANWVYQGVPANPWLRDLAYFWSFATIIPGVFETADLVGALFRRGSKSVAHRRLGPAWLWFVIGLAMVTIPLTIPTPAAAYFFGSVWIGFTPLLEPLNERLGAGSLLADWRRGHAAPTYALLIGGLLCGFLWETWNYQAFLTGGGHWVYTVPQPLRVFGLHFGQMPVLGLLGFPPFALELYAAYAFLREILGGDRLFGTPPVERRWP